jgi:hypothetical protein
LYTMSRHSTTRSSATTHAIDIMSTQVTKNILNYFYALCDAVRSFNSTLLQPHHLLTTCRWPSPTTKAPPIPSSTSAPRIPHAASLRRQTCLFSFAVRHSEYRALRATNTISYAMRKKLCTLQRSPSSERVKLRTRERKATWRRQFPCWSPARRSSKASRSSKQRKSSKNSKKTSK